MNLSVVFVLSYLELPLFLYHLKKGRPLFLYRHLKKGRPTPRFTSLACRFSPYYSIFLESVRDLTSCIKTIQRIYLLIC